MVTVKDCIIGRIRACGPCSPAALRSEVTRQQTEYQDDTGWKLDLAISESLNELVREGSIRIDFTDKEAWFDL